MKRLREDFFAGWSRVFSPAIPQKYCLGPDSEGFSQPSICSARIGSVSRITIRSTNRKKVS